MKCNYWEKLSSFSCVFQWSVHRLSQRGVQFTEPAISIWQLEKLTYWKDTELQLLHFCSLWEHLISNFQMAVQALKTQRLWAPNGGQCDKLNRHSKFVGSSLNTQRQSSDCQNLLSALNSGMPRFGWLGNPGIASFKGIAFLPGSVNSVEVMEPGRLMYMLRDAVQEKHLDLLKG